MNILLIGANSAIATAVARLYASDGHSLFLVGRDLAKLETLRDDLTVRGAGGVALVELDITHTARHTELIERAHTALGTIELAIICHGLLPDQEKCERDFTALQASLDVNVISTLSLLVELGKYFGIQGKGSLAVITSVAGDRGRRSNYVYGASKSMISTFLEGLRGRLHDSGVNVIDIRPGLVDSPMTRELKKGPLFSTPERVARCIVKGIKKNRTTLYAPAYWRFVMLVVKAIPQRLFKRLRF
jgi:short-subunit dehydrogenase